jgi:hypothetical protein
MVSQARRYLALDRLLRDPRRLEEYRLSREHRQRLDAWRREANLNVRVAITSAYCHLFYPVGDADSPYRPFAHERLHIEDQGDTRANHTETVLRRLRELNKVKSAEDAPMAPALVRRDAFGKDEGMVTLQSLFERFAERVRLPLLLEPTYLKEVVRLGIRNKVWLYCDLAANLAYDSDQDLPDIVIDAQHALALPSEVEAKGIPIYRRERPSREGRAAEGEAVTLMDREPVAAPLRLEAHGDPGLALAELEARARDARWPALGQIDRGLLAGHRRRYPGPPLRPAQRAGAPGPGYGGRGYRALGHVPRRRPVGDEIPRPSRALPLPGAHPGGPGRRGVRGPCQHHAAAQLPLRPARGRPRLPRPAGRAEPGWPGPHPRHRLAI